MLGLSSGWFIRMRARVAQAPVQVLQAAPREELRLRDLAILWWLRAARGDRTSGGPVHHARLTDLECLAGPSALHLATPHNGFDLTPRISQRAEWGRRSRLSPTTSLGRLECLRPPVQN
jgi:hypothetical protein